jgi:hypothetical protein
MYIGSRNSENYMRIYEHAKLHGGDITCRIEYECKPGKTDRKRQLADLEPAQILGLWPFVIELLAAIGVSIAKLKPSPYTRQKTDLEIRTLNCARQYGRTIDDLMALHDDDPAAVIGAIRIAQSVIENGKAELQRAAARPLAVPLILL